MFQSKWADYIITGIHYNVDHKHIESLEVRYGLEPMFGFVGKAFIMTRQAVIKSLKEGNSYITAIGSDYKWYKGSEVQIIRVNGREYIRTDGNSRESDNLGELPEF